MAVASRWRVSPAAARASASRCRYAEPAVSEPFRILVVDDEPAQRELVGGFLTKHGFQVTEAADGRQALAHFREDLFDLVLTDQRMPDLSGLEVLGEHQIEQVLAKVGQR